MRPSARTVKEVSDYLSRWRKDYITFLDRVRDALKDLPQRRDFRSLVHRVYSREDRQLGEKLKDPERIAVTLQKIRANGSGTKPEDVPDIVGVTIVCPYPSDIARVVKRLRPLLKSKKIAVKQTRGHAWTDYKATHLIVSPREQSVGHIACEIQIKSMLHDAWNAKTHDLTYKPSVKVSPKLRSQMERLFDVMNSIDHQSEIIRDQIREQEELDGLKRKATRQSLILAFHKRRGVRYRALQDILKRIEADKDKPGILTGPNFDSDRYAPFRDLTKMANAALDQNLLRVCTYLASLLEQPNVDNWVVDRIDEWIDQQTEVSEKIAALRFKAVALLTIDRLGEAIDANDKAVAAVRAARKRMRAAAFRKLLAAVEMNGAYYRAEYCYVTQSDYPAYEEAARKALRQYFKRDGIPGNQLDTAGLILITFGKTPTEIRTGMQYCARALATFPRRDRLKACAEDFVELHERRAFKRLLEMAR